MNRIFSLFIAGLFICIQASAQDLTVSNLFSDHMVLQQKTDVKVWGKSKAGTSVMVRIDNSYAVADTDNEGNWVLSLPSPEAGGPYEMLIEGNSQKLSIEDVMVGEVWFASGQSNMAWQVKNSMNYEEEQKLADLPEIRFFQVPRMFNNHPVDEMKFGEWIQSNPESVGTFSATAFFFARDLFQQYNVPVGIIQSAWGGTPSESFTSYEMHESLKEFELEYKEMLQEDFDSLLNVNTENTRTKNSLKKNPKLGVKKGVNKDDYDTGEWEIMSIPGNFNNTDIKGFRGFVWFQKEFEISGKYAGEELLLDLGRIEQSDATWINGKWIGGTLNANSIREYKLKRNVLEKGRNVITVRVLNDRSTGGGFWKGPFEIRDTVDNKVVCDLSGEWKYNEKIEEPWPEVINYHHIPALIYNAMIAPVMPYTIKGAIWYQGESNSGRAEQYARIFPAMIQDWRIQWGQGYFPFLFVQLANFMDKDKEPNDASWPNLRQAQTKTLELVNTGMATIIDIGEAKDIHPKNKQDVGGRLFTSARKVAYGEDIVHCGPTYLSHESDEARISITFENCGTGLEVRNFDKVTGFAIAGEDGKFVWANAEIIAPNQIRVWADEVSNPAEVRYAWSNNPDASLYNSAGLPAVPFKTSER